MKKSRREYFRNYYLTKIKTDPEKMFRRKILTTYWYRINGRPKRKKVPKERQTKEERRQKALLRWELDQKVINSFQDVSGV